MAIVLLVSLLFFAVPASADVLSWSAEPIPGAGGNVLGPEGIDVRDLAVAADGMTIYAAPGDSISQKAVYISTDAGVSWTALTVPLQADLVAVAPDDPNTVAVARQSAPAVYLTVNGGSTWRSLGAVKDKDTAAAVEICALAISAASREIHYIAVAGREAGNVANVWYCQGGSAAPVWEQTRNLPGFRSASAVKAVAFSPDFPLDRVMVAIGETDHQSVNFEVLSFDSRKWNEDAGFSGYPVAIVTDDGITGLTSASLSLHPDYSRSDDKSPVAFVGLAVNGDAEARATSGIYRLENTDKEALKTGINIHSVAFDGSHLVAGAGDDTAVYHSANPLRTTPRVDAVSPLKRPGGENRVAVAWAGSNVVAGTSGNESAFAISRNKGKTFNDISLIDTALTSLVDVAVAADGSAVYLVTDDGSDLSLWRRSASWQRVLSRQDTTSYLVRLAPGEADVVYLAERGARTIYYSSDGGETEWSARTCDLDIQDLAVESGSVAYALNQECEVARSNNTGLSWGEAESTELDDEDFGHMIVSAGEDNLLVGSASGYVAYSTNGNSSWSKIPQQLHSGAEKVQVVASNNFASDRTIYAASDKIGQDIKRWIIGTSNQWTDIFRNALTGGVYGLLMDGSALYALEFNPYRSESRLWQCLSPATATDVSRSWESRTSTPDAIDTGVCFNATPQALRASFDGRLWAIKTNGTNRLYCLTDIMTGLKLKTPEPEFTSPVNLVTGIAEEVKFRWERPFSAAEKYELEIALDEEFTKPVTTITVSSDQSTVIVPIGPDRTGDARFDFMAGTAYYWRVRVTQPLYHLYSETHRFTVETLEIPPPVIIERPPPAVIEVPPPPSVEVPFPEIKPSPPSLQLPPPLKIVIPPAPEVPAPVTPPYAWAIIAIVAVLTIVLMLIIFADFLSALWLREGRYRWSRLRRRLCEAKYLKQPLPVASSLADIEACLAQVTWTMDGPFHLFDAISYPQTVWTRKKDDCDGFAILAAALLQQWQPASKPVLLTAMLWPLRRSHTVCAFSVPGAGLWFFDNNSLRRGRFRTYAEIISRIKGKAKLVCWDVVDPDTLQTVEFHRA